ncbi:unnamed protein product [Rotaria sp. Silwood2]|nr:unnamed protein product [Rotaria sp. Silwood2]
MDDKTIVTLKKPKEHGADSSIPLLGITEPTKSIETPNSAVIDKKTENILVVAKKGYLVSFITGEAEILGCLAVSLIVANFTIFFVNDIDELNHILLQYKRFQEEKSGINIWYEIEEIFKSFNLSFGNTPVTTDQESNMIKTLNLTDEVRYSWLAHRTNTILETVWKNLKTTNIEFKDLCTTVGNLRTYCQQSGGNQFKLPRTLKSTCGSRPCRLFFLIYDS